MKGAVRELREGEPLTARAVALWHDCGLTRPWNDPGADLLRALRGPSSTVLVLLAGERLLGTAMLGHDGHRGWVYYLAVDPGSRGGGVGASLMAASERWLRERGIPKLHVMVRGGNEPARAFYERLGYRPQDTTVLGRWLED